MPVKKVEPTKAGKKAAPLIKKPLWNLYRDGVTQGFTKRFLDCPEQARLSYVEGLAPKGISGPLTFGTVFHKLLEQVPPNISEPAAWSRTIDNTLNDCRTKYVKDAKPTADDLQKWEEIVGQVATVFPSYLDHWAKKDREMTWVLREETFRENVQADGLQSITLRGRFDGIFEIKGTKGVYLFESKTKGRIDEDGIQATLPTDIQTMLYCTAAQTHLARPVLGVRYNMIRQPQLRRKVDESLTTFLDRIKEDIRKQPDHYFKRLLVTFDKHDLDHWRSRVLFPILRRIQQWYDSIEDWNNPWASPFHYMNPEALATRWGSRCDLFDVLTSGNRFRYYRKKVPFPELED